MKYFNEDNSNNDDRNKNKPNNNKNKKQFRNFNNMKKGHSITFWIVLLLVAVIIYTMYNSSQSNITEISYTEFKNMIEKETVQKVVFSEKDVRIWDEQGRQYHTYLPFLNPDLADELTEKGINVSSQKPSQVFSFLISILPFIIFLAFWFIIMRSMQGGSKRAFSFGKSKARLFSQKGERITFEDVAGVEEAKDELTEIVEFLKEPKKFQKLGGRIPRGVVLIGRPGTGKTLLAKAVAGEAKVPFYSISGSDFVEMFVGVGASRVRDMFTTAKKSSPCIIFIDEIDAVGRHRGTGLGGGHDEREQTLNQLLVEMDGFEKNDSVIVIAATNRPDILDPALLRPGRFDRQVTVDLPDIKGRREILKVHTNKLPISDNVRLEVIARSTPGFSGADLANLANEAALIAARHSKTEIEMSDFEEAKDKVMMGKEKRSKVIPEEIKKINAYHEVGHVLCSVFQDKTEPLHKVTIIPRGFAAGLTMSLQDEKTVGTRTYFTQQITVLLGGRTAEEIQFNELSIGAGNDIKKATELAQNMVCKWGMSDIIGPMTVGKENNEVFLGKQLTQKDFFSEETAQKVDSEVRAIVSKAHKNARTILKERANLLETLANKLLDEETLDVDEIYNIILENIPKEDRDFVKNKYRKAKDLKLISDEDDEDTDEDTDNDKAEENKATPKSPTKESTPEKKDKPSKYKYNDKEKSEDTSQQKDSENSNDREKKEN